MFVYMWVKYEFVKSSTIIVRLCSSLASEYHTNFILELKVVYIS